MINIQFSAYSVQNMFNIKTFEKVKLRIFFLYDIIINDLVVMSKHHKRSVNVEICFVKHLNK